MGRAIKTGILSFGMSGSLFHAPFLNIHSGFELVGVVERKTKKAQSIYPNIKSFDSVDEILNDSEIELLVINTPSPTHFEFALKAIQAKKHILVEKPFTVTSAEAKKLYAESEKHNCMIMPFQNRRYDSDFLSVKQVIESGKLGNLVEVHFRYDRYNYNISNNRVKESNTPGNGLLYNLGPHVIDAAIALFGLPIKWSKVKKGNRPNTQIDDYAHVHLEYVNGLQVFAIMSLLAADAQKSFVLHGTKGSYVKDRCDTQEMHLQSGILPDSPLYGVELPNQEGILTTVEDGIKKQEKIISEKASYLSVFEDVYQTIYNKKEYPITRAQIIRQIEILEN
ncbi:Gfo/Idh/MocA family oxidoreductase [Polaribacter sp. Z014]|uniref:Gfo/Idh/MocA family oxidoreductase n=1 Tax=Polaribacter sp. Z014 TaxID=2927126 RepID=UPI0020204383|nr:Gfo/Idh/MocA family oxidoreductase [Polaribacter sp. Z014]MCL7762564.1 Gfo/Idh/MocA family oxidoreductase [Polaribacter sp. Z014]